MLSKSPLFVLAIILKIGAIATGQNIFRTLNLMMKIFFLLSFSFLAAAISAQRSLASSGAGGEGRRASSGAGGEGRRGLRETGGDGGSGGNERDLKKNKQPEPTRSKNKNKSGMKSKSKKKKKNGMKTKRKNKKKVE